MLEIGARIIPCVGFDFDWIIQFCWLKWLNMLKVKRSARRHWRAIKGEVLKSEGSATVDEEASKGNEKALKDYEKALKGNEEAYRNEGNEKALMGDKRRYRTTEDVIRWQERHWGLWRCAKRRQEHVFIAFRSTPFFCNWRPFRRPLTSLFRPERPFSLTPLCCNWRPFRRPLLPFIRPERLSITF